MARLTPEQWALVRKEREEDGTPYRSLAAKHGVSDAAIIKRAKAEGWGEVSGAKSAPKVRKKVGANRANAVEIIEPPAQELDDSEFEPADQIPPGCRTRARTKIGAPGLDDPAIGELLEYDPGDLADLFEPDFPNRGLYRPQFVRVAYKFFLLGATVEQLADVLCVDSRTIYRWAKDHPAFDMAMRGGREMADANVASRLYARAMGYSHEEEEIKVIDNKVVRVPTVKHYPPDPGAAIFWLKNRQPELWKERVEVKEQPTIALVDKQAMDEIYRNALEHAAQVQERMMGRAERMGLTIDQGLDDGE